MKRTFLLGLAFMILFFPGALSFAEDLDGLVQEALDNNPSLAAARARWEQSTYKSTQVGSLKDPVLSLALSNYPSDDFSADITPMTGNEVKIAQAFPVPGKLAEQSAIADEQAQWFNAFYRDQHYQVASKVKDAWYRLYFNGRAIDVTQRNIQLVDDVIRLTEVRYETGSGLQQDVLKAQIQRSSFMEKMITLKQERTVLEAELDRLLARERTAGYTSPKELELPQVDLSLDAILDASKNRPLYAAYQSLKKRYRHQQKLAELDDSPEMTLWGSWRFRDDDLPDGGTDFVSVGVSFSLPVYREKRRAALAEATVAQYMAEQQTQEFQNNVNAAIRNAYARAEQARQQALLYREGIIPQTAQSFQSALGSYQVGKVAFVSLLDALMTTFKAELAYYKANTEYMRNLARLEAESTVTLLGAPIQIKTREPVPEEEAIN